MLTKTIENSDAGSLFGFHNVSDRQFEQFSITVRPDKLAESNPTILQAATPAQLIQVRNLMRAFVGWLRNRYQDSGWFIDGYFDERAYEAELATLPGEYAPPTGRLLLAKYQGKPSGCVAIRKMKNNSCEMKRLYVASEFQGNKIGKILVKALINEAKSIGYRRIVLDTGCRQVEAQNLYRSLGFEEIGPYYDMPQRVKNMLVFMELKL